MKTLAITFLALTGILTFSQTSRADYVSGYTRSNGTYVAPYVRSHADGNPYNNWSSFNDKSPVEQSPYSPVTTVAMKAV